MYVLKSDLPSDVALIEENYRDADEIDDFLDEIESDLVNVNNRFSSRYQT